MLDLKALNPTEVGQTSERKTVDKNPRSKVKTDSNEVSISELSEKSDLREELLDNLFNYLHVHKTKK
jgi:hypothetical protein